MALPLVDNPKKSLAGKLITTKLELIAGSDYTVEEEKPPSTTMF